MRRSFSNFKPNRVLLIGHSLTSSMPEQNTNSPLFADQEAVPGVLTDVEIEAAVSRGALITGSTFHATSLEPSSYDIRVGRKGIIGGQGVELDLSQSPMELEPGAYGGVVSYERLHLPSNVCARIGSKRALSYDGVILLTGSLVDPGYEGHLLFGLYNASQRRVLIRSGRKICNIVFERLSDSPERQAPSDPNLQNGAFPDAFVDRMANMDVLPWMQISERVKQIETITKDILDLKARYDDVLEPIRDLTNNVKSLTSDVTSLTQQTKSIAKDVENVNSMVGENSRQINTLTTNLATMVAQVHAVQERTRNLEDEEKTQAETITTLRTRLGRFQLLIYIFLGHLAFSLGRSDH
jgi:dCTP deaminase